MGHHSRAQGTELATAQVNTLRLKLLKIGARIRETSRRIWVHLASGYPYRDLLAGLLQNLRWGRAHKRLEQQMVGEFLFRNLLSGHRYLLFLRKTGRCDL
jgi:hypothetical protein